jgi:hypothetical protein
MVRRITIPAPMIMAIPMNATIAMTPGLMSKGYAVLLPHTATFDQKLVTGRSNGPGAYATVYATARTLADVLT